MSTKKNQIVDVELAHQRIEEANAIIATIAKHGRQFFAREDRTGKFELNPKHTGLVFVDAYRGGRSDVVEDKAWPNFSNGGTLKALVLRLGDYIKGGPPLNRSWIGTERGDGSNIWGYERQAMLDLHTELTGMPGMTRIEDDPIPDYMDTRELNEEASSAPGI